MKNERAVQARIRQFSPYLRQRSNTIANPRSKQMTKFNSTHKISAGAVFGAAILFSMLSFGSSAEASNILSCHGNTAGQVISCCEKLVKKNGRPMWMIGNSCKKIAVCRAPGLIAVAAVAPNRCYARLADMNDAGGPGGGGNPGRPTRSSSTSSNNPN
jgi:hypothetical protein